MDLKQVRLLEKLSPAQRRELDRSGELVHGGATLLRGGKPKQAQPLLQQTLKIRKELLERFTSITLWF